MITCAVNVDCCVEGKLIRRRVIKEAVVSYREAAVTRTRAPSQYLKRRLFVRSRKVSKPRDLYLELSDRSEIWQALRQQCCRCACQISKRYGNLKYQSHGFETLRDLTKRRLSGYWDGAQGLVHFAYRGKWNYDSLNDNIFICSQTYFQFSDLFIGYCIEISICNTAFLSVQDFVEESFLTHRAKRRFFELIMSAPMKMFPQISPKLNLYSVINILAWSPSLTKRHDYNCHVTGYLPPLKIPLISLWRWVARRPYKVLSVISTNTAW